MNIRVERSSVVLVRNRTLAFVAATALVVAACAKKRTDVKPVDEHEGQSATSCLAIPSIVDRDVTVGEKCTLVVEHPIVVRAGAKLVVGAGTKLAFAAGAGIRLEQGALVTHGRQDAPVLFTSHAETQAPGDWAGVRFVASMGSSLTSTTIEYAGGEWSVIAPAPSASTSASPSSKVSVKSPSASAALLTGEPLASTPSGDRAAIVVDDATRDLVLDHARVVHSLHGAMSVRGGDSFARMTECAFESNGGFSVETVADAVPVLAGSTFGEDARVCGSITRSATWPADVSLVVEGTLIVASPGSPTLTLPPGTTLRFARDAGLAVGDGLNAGALVAKKTTFTSAESKPKPGDWGGIDLSGAALATTIEDCTVAYASASKTYGSVGALGKFLGIPSPVVRTPFAGKITIAGTTFKSCDAPAFSGDVHCDGYEAPKLHNVSIGQPLCATSPPITNPFGSLTALGPDVSGGLAGVPIGDSFSNAPLGDGDGADTGYGKIGGPSSGAIGIPGGASGKGGGGGSIQGSAKPDAGSTVGATD